MSNLVVEKSSKASPEEVFREIKSLLENDVALRKIDPSYTCRFDDDRRVGFAESSKFRADLKVFPEGEGSRVCIEVRLPFLMSAFKEKIRGILQGKLEEKLS